MEAPSITIEDGPPNTVIGRIADDRNIEVCIYYLSMYKCLV